MHDELTRAAVSVPVATMLGLLFGGRLIVRVAAGLLAGLLVLLALADHLGTSRPWLIASVACAGAALMPAHNPPGTVSSGKTVLRALVQTVIVTLLAALIADATAARHALGSLADDREIVFVFAGGLAAVFVGGEIIARILHPLAAKASRDATGMENAGRYIGWLERTLLYGLILAGAPDAAALVIAGKSIARFPSFSREAFAEYYLIGSLLSLAIVAAVAIGVRALLGLTPLPSTRA